MANIEQLRTFLEIAATGNFNHAAENLNVSQSTVSARIKGLEERLDRQLFRRSRSGAELTGAGRRFERYAAWVVQSWEQGRQQVALPEGYRTLFGLGTQVSLWERLVAQWLPWMREQAPDVALHVETDYSQSLMRQLSDGLLDIIVLYYPRTMTGVVIETLLEERLVLVSTRRRKITSDWQEDYIYVDWGDDYRAELAKAFPEVEASAISVGLGAIGLQYILVNGGSGYFPMRVVRPYLTDKRLFRVTGAPTFKRPAYMVYSADPADPETVQLARQGLVQIATMESER